MSTRIVLPSIASVAPSERQLPATILPPVTQSRQPPGRPFTVSVEGNVGSGKSTFLRHFHGAEGVHLMEEPLEKWCNVNGHNLLDMLYREPSRWSFLFQTYIQLTRLQIHTDRTPCRVKIIERSLQNSRFCFIELARSLGSIGDAELHVLDSYYRLLERQTDIGVDLVVYLRTTPEVAYQRVRRRARAEESAVSLKYLQLLHERHERWLLQPPADGAAVGGSVGPSPAAVLVIDADQPLDCMLNVYDANRDAILGRKAVSAAAGL